GDEVVAAEPADLPLDAALLVRALQAGLAVERIDAEVRTERGPSGGFDALPGEPEGLGDRRPQVVVADLAGRDPSNMRVSLSSPGNSLRSPAGTVQSVRGNDM